MSLFSGIQDAFIHSIRAQVLTPEYGWNATSTGSILVKAKFIRLIDNIMTWYLPFLTQPVSAMRLGLINCWMLMISTRLWLRILLSRDEINKKINKKFVLLIHSRQSKTASTLLRMLISNGNAKVHIPNSRGSTMVEAFWNLAEPRWQKLGVRRADRP